MPPVASPTPTNVAAYQLPKLKIVGTNIVAATNESKLLQFKGVNIGGWLVPEAWMCGMNDKGFTWSQSNQTKYIEILEARFTANQTKKLMNIWYDSWMTIADLNNLQSFGFNLLRVPFTYRNFKDANGNWYRDASGKIDFRHLDWIVKEAGKRGMYTLLDFHVWRGRLECYSCISQN